MHKYSHDVSSAAAATVEPAKRQKNRALREKWRKRLFRFWVGGSAIVALYLVLAGPLTAFTGLEKPTVALVVAPFMFLLLASGLVWLILLVRSRR